MPHGYDNFVFHGQYLQKIKLNDVDFLSKCTNHGIIHNYLRIGNNTLQVYARTDHIEISMISLFLICQVILLGMEIELGKGKIKIILEFPLLKMHIVY